LLRTPEQIIRKLLEVKRLLGEGKTIAEATRELEISEQTFRRWRAQYGEMKADDAKRSMAAAALGDHHFPYRFRANLRA